MPDFNALRVFRETLSRLASPEVNILGIPLEVEEHGEAETRLLGKMTPEAAARWNETYCAAEDRPPLPERVKKVMVKGRLDSENEKIFLNAAFMTSYGMLNYPLCIQEMRHREKKTSFLRDCRLYLQKFMAPPIFVEVEFQGDAPVVADFRKFFRFCFSSVSEKESERPTLCTEINRLDFFDGGAHTEGCYYAFADGVTSILPLILNEKPGHISGMILCDERRFDFTTEGVRVRLTEVKNADKRKPRPKGPKL